MASNHAHVDLPDPFAEPVLRDFQTRFFKELSQRNFAACQALLNEARLQTRGAQAFFDYHAAILSVDTSRWDEAERRLLILMRQPLHPKLHIRVLNELGMVAEYLGRFMQSMQSYQQALAWLERGDSPDVLYEAKVRMNLSICYIRAYEAGELDASYLDKTRELLRQSIAALQNEGARELERNAWNELGAAFKAAGQWSEAITSYETARRLCEELKDSHGLAGVFNNIGEILQAQNSPEAHEYFSQAAELFRSHGNLYETADALANLGTALAKLSRPYEALKAFRDALECTESLRERLTQNETRADFFATQSHIYGSVVEHLISIGQLADAFDMAERARARGLLELIGNGQVHPPRNFPEELLLREQTLRAQLQEQVAGSAGSGETIARQLTELYHQMQLFSNEFAAFKHVAPLRIGEVLERLPADTALVSYFATRSEVIGFCLSGRHGLQIFRCGISVSQLEVGSFDSHGQVQSVVPVTNVLPRPWFLEKLYAAVVEPFLPYCQEHRRLLIIPHGPLHALPLHATRKNQNSRYLVEVYDIVYAPSATIAVEYLQAKRPDALRKGCLAVFSGAEDIPQGLREAETIAQLTAGEPLVGQAASPQVVLDRARHYRYLHVSSHGRFHREAPLTSGLLLATGPLTTWDLLQSPELGLSLISLNACETGRNLVRHGDELYGLLRALLYSGAPSVLLTLWKVEISARLFMQTFYEEVTQHSDPLNSRFSESLASTIRRFRALDAGAVRRILREDGWTDEQVEAMLMRIPRLPSANAGQALPDHARLFDHPYFWAPFVLVGERWVTDSAA